MRAAADAPEGRLAHGGLAGARLALCEECDLPAGRGELPGEQVHPVRRVALTQHAALTVVEPPPVPADREEPAAVSRPAQGERLAGSPRTPGDQAAIRIDERDPSWSVEHSQFMHR